MKKINNFVPIYTPSLLTMLTWACFFIFTSCVTKKEVTKEEVKIEKSKTSINDSILINSISNSNHFISKKKITTVNELLSNNTIFKCDSTFFQQKFKFGNSDVTIKKENGIVNVEVNKPKEIQECEQNNEILIKEKDSLIKKLSQKEKTDSVFIKQSFSKEVVKKPFFANLWQILFFIILILWFFGLTPLKIIKLIKPI